MVAKVLTNCMELGSQTAVDEFTLNGAVSGALRFEDAGTLVVGSNPEGEEFEVKVIYSDQNYSTEWEVMVASWTLDGSVHKLERQRTIASSSSGASINFDAGVNNIKLFGVSSHEQFDRNADARILQTGTQRGSGAWGTFTVDHDTNTNVAATVNTLIVSPTNPNSSLYYWFSFGFVTERDGTDGSGVRSRVEVMYKNSSGIFSATTDAIDFGFFGMPTVDSNFGARYPAAINDALTSTEKNASGDWELQPFIRIIDAGTHVSLLDCAVHWMEIG